MCVDVCVCVHAAESLLAFLGLSGHAPSKNAAEPAPGTFSQTLKKPAAAAATAAGLAQPASFSHNALSHNNTSSLIARLFAQSSASFSSNWFAWLQHFHPHPSASLGFQHNSCQR
jgi:hypothetical protein